MIQIWNAVITILILQALKNQSKFAWYLSNLVASIRLKLLFELKLLKRVKQTDLLIIDDFGLHPFDQNTRKTKRKIKF